MTKQERICDWIIENLEIANNFGLRGIVPIDINDNQITFQVVGYRVVYSYDPDIKALMRADNITEAVGNDPFRLLP